MLAKRIEEAQEIAIQDYFAARTCLVNCRATGLTKAETEMVISIIATASEIDTKVIRALAREVGNEHPDHGPIDNAAELESAVEKELAAQFGSLMVTGGEIFAYQANSDHEDFGTWKRLPGDIFDRTSIQSFSTGITAQTTMHREAKRRFYTLREDPHAFAQPTSGVALENGFLKYDEAENSLELVPHSADHLARNKIDVNYNEEALANEFEVRLVRSFGGEIDKMRLFLEFLACAVFGIRPRHDLVRACLILFGRQRTGKSALLSFVQLFFLPEQIANISPDLLGKPERNVALAGRSINVVSELHSKKKMDGAILKKFFSGEAVSGRHLYKDLFSFSSTCMHFYACNDIPSIDETHPSVQRRFAFISMGLSLSDQEAAQPLEDVINDEAEGIVALVAQSLLNVMERGCFILPDDSNDLVSRMQFGNDIAALFGRVRLEGRAGARLSSDDLRRAMRDFASEIGADPDEAVNDGTMKRLSRFMNREWGVIRRKTNGRPFYEGVAFRNGAPATAQSLSKFPSAPPGIENAKVVDLADL